MPKYSVPIYFVCYVDVDADDADQAWDMAGTGDTEFTITTNFINQAGGCIIYHHDTGTPVLMEEEENA